MVPQGAQSPSELQSKKEQNLQDPPLALHPCLMQQKQASRGQKKRLVNNLNGHSHGTANRTAL